MDPHFPASSALPPHLRPVLGEARLRAHWPGDALVRALGVREPMPRGLVRRPGGTGDIFLACFHQPVLVRLSDGRVRVPANTLVVWLPGMAQEYGLEDAAWIHSWIHLRGSLAETLTSCAGLASGVAIPLPGPETLEGPAIELHVEMVRRPVDTAVIEALAAILLRRLARHAPRAADGLAEAHRRIVGNPGERLPLADLAELAGCSQQHLCRAFRERYGVTPVALAARLRLERAAQLLAGGMAPASVAEECGWADTRQFARVFRACFGKTPAGWGRR
jgi:AraC-like DNA-binding protein